MNNNIKEYEITVEDDWIGIRVKSNILVRDTLIIQILRDLFSMEDYKNDKIAGLWDFRGCKGDIRYDSIMNIKEYIDINYDQNWSQSITAFVVDHDLPDGLSHMSRIISDELPTTIRVFKDMNKAKDWIREEIIQRKKTPLK